MLIFIHNKHQSYDSDYHEQQYVLEMYLADINKTQFQLCDTTCTSALIQSCFSVVCLLGGCDQFILKTEIGKY